MDLTLLKGHGTENDFILVPDPDAQVELDVALVRRLCDRHAGIGADGVLRVVPTAAVAEVAPQADVAPWFMDYRNADGSVAEMCGNGVRVFARYLVAAGLVDPARPLQVATRAGAKGVRFDADGRISVDMGRASRLAGAPQVRVPLRDGHGVVTFAGSGWELPNPHVVCEVRDHTQLAQLDLRRPPAVEPPLPHGQNVEFVVRDGPREVTMRVHERGVGETRSCGTGICAVVAAVAAPADLEPWTVHVPGGTCTVTPSASGSSVLTGPAVLVAEVRVQREWLAR